MSRPTRPTSPGKYPQAQNLFTVLANDQEVDKGELAAGKTVLTGSAKVRVLNGSGTSGHAARVAEQLHAGFVDVWGQR